MPGERRSNFAWWCAATIFLGALMLFMVQPIISKLILPWYGGSPAVWTTCMLFFQTLLLAGYSYAHLLDRKLSLGWQMRTHGFVVLLAALTLPISPSAAWEPDPGVDPVLPILWLLTCNVGLPFFALAATGPLLQSWFGGVYPSVAPYRLYALSNVGSLSALLMFPFLLEPNLDSIQQDLLWSTGFGIYLVCIFVMSVIYEREPPPSSDSIIYPQKSSPAPSPTWIDMTLWVALPALASVMFVAFTSHICQDMAVVPFLQILPLSLYLVTFILAFDNPYWYIRPLWGMVAAMSIVGICVIKYDDKIQKFINTTVAKWFKNEADSGWETWLANFDLSDYTGRADIEIIVYMLALFSVAMICHGETTRRKPTTNYLTLFYLMISAGGVLGTGLVAIVCPLVFNRYDELNIVVVLGFVVAATVLLASILTAKFSLQWRYTIAGVVSLFLASDLAFVLTAQFQNSERDYDTQQRNFYGVASVYTYRNKNKEPYGRVLYNGQINHGFQYLHGERRFQPNSYYSPGSGVDFAFRALRDTSDASLKVGVIGLGTGTLAANGRQGDEFRFYEIDEKIVRICNDYFTYLQDLKEREGKVDVILGDARLSLAHELKRGEKQQFDILVLDAFSGDAIPIHLLTLEAMQLYARHMSDRGVLAVHVSNRHLELAPIVARLADQMQVKAILVEHYDTGDGADEASSDWVLVTNNPEVLDFSLVMLNGHPLTTLANHLADDDLKEYRQLNKVDRQTFLNLSPEDRLEYFKLSRTRRPKYLADKKHHNLYDHSDAPLWTDKFSNLWNVLK